MSCGNPHETACDDVRSIFIIFLENLTPHSAFESVLSLLDEEELRIALPDHTPVAAQVIVHFEECEPCRDLLEMQRMQFDRRRANFARKVFEESPSDLFQRLQAQTRALASAQAFQSGDVTITQTHTYTEYRRTEITADGEIRIEIETTHEIIHEEEQQ